MGTKFGECTGSWHVEPRWDRIPVIAYRLVRVWVLVDPDGCATLTFPSESEAARLVENIVKEKNE